MSTNKFKNWGLRIRADRGRNYYAVWNNLETVRLDLGEVTPLPPEESEFYDVGITERCNACCDFCYVEAAPTKKDYPGIVENWKSWIGGFPVDTPITPEEDPILADILTVPEKGKNTPTEVLFKIKTAVTYNAVGAKLTRKPFQVAIGSVGEPTIHPEFPEFLRAIYESGVVPNYTTNGIVLASRTEKAAKILDATRECVGGVAISMGNKSLREVAKGAIRRVLTEGNCKVVLHELIGSPEDIDDLLELDREYGKNIHYHVLLPLMAHGRSHRGMDNNTYLQLVERTSGMTNLAYGANFAPFMRENTVRPRVWEYPQECYSKNILLQGDGVVITPSSYNLTPIIKI